MIRLMFDCRNVSEPLDDRDELSKSAAQVRAAIEAIKIAKAWGIGRMVIHTDSKYVRNVIENLIFYWLDNGWRKTTGNLIKHRKLWRELLFTLEDMDVEWKYLKGSNVYDDGSTAANRLARQGAERY